MRLYHYFLIIFLSLGFLGCQKSEKADIVVGTMSGPEADLVKTASGIASKNFGLKVKVIEFSDYQLPNEALSDGSIDMNIYQHLPFLKASIDARAYAITPIAKTFIYPMGIYSKRFTHLNDLPPKALIAIPNDPSNQTRALMVLASAGLIKCPKKDLLSLKDILANPKELKIKELDAAQLPRLLNDVDAAVINTTYALPAGLSPKKDSLFIESKDSPYANLIVVRTELKDLDKYQKFIQAMQDKSVVQKAKDLFGDAAIHAWND